MKMKKSRNTVCVHHVHEHSDYDKKKSLNLTLKVARKTGVDESQQKSVHMVVREDI
jgi:hypothetical protein